MILLILNLIQFEQSLIMLVLVFGLGFGLGTMHLPVSVVKTTEGQNSIINAINDSCDVYGELNLIDEDVKAEIKECLAPIQTGFATVEDIPDEELRGVIKSKVIEIALAISPDHVIEIATRILEFPLAHILKMFTYFNTPEYKDIYLKSLAGADIPSLDNYVLSLGRPSGGLEEVETQCKIIIASHLTSEALTQNFEEYKDQIVNSLDSNMSAGINIYKCGKLDRFVEGFGSSCDGDTEMERYVCDKVRTLIFHTDFMHTSVHTYNLI